MVTYKRNIKASQRFEYGTYQFLEHFLGHRRVNKIFKKRRKAFYENLGNTLKQSGEGKIIPIERRSNLSLEEFKNEYRKKGIPVVIEGGAKEWDCVNKWSLEYFKELYGDDEVVLKRTPRFPENDIVKSLDEVIDNIRSGGTDYYRFYALLKRHPERINDFDYRWLREHKNRNSWAEAFAVFIGGKDTLSNLHNENTANLFIQAHGEKKWVLFPPYYTPIMNPEPVKAAFRSPVKNENGPFNPFSPDFGEPFTHFKYIDRYETVLKPGDILWIPPFYWHAVLNISHSIGVGYRWLSPSFSFKIAPLYMFLDFFATHPTIWKFVQKVRKEYRPLDERNKLDTYFKEKKEVMPVRNMNSSKA